MLSNKSRVNASNIQIIAVLFFFYLNLIISSHFPSLVRPAACSVLFRQMLRSFSSLSSSTDLFFSLLLCYLYALECSVFSPFIVSTSVHSPCHLPANFSLPFSSCQLFFSTSVLFLKLLFLESIACFAQLNILLLYYMLNNKKSYFKNYKNIFVHVNASIQIHW